MVKCSNCGSVNQSDVKICLTCGFNPENGNLKNQVQNFFKLDFENTPNLPNQILDSFFKTLRYRVETELDTNGYRAYFDLFHSSGVYKNFEIRSQQLTEELLEIHAKNEPNQEPKAEQFLDQALNAFVDYFIIAYCKSLHKMNLPQAMLRHEKIQFDTLDFKKMVLDFLDFENENDKAYIGFLEIPANKLANAKAAFLFTENDENLFFICDQTVFGSCKEGFAMTDKTLYWKAHFNEPEKMSFNDLKNIKQESEWITINGLFFNVNKTMNYKMLMLLRKIQLLFRQ